MSYTEESKTGNHEWINLLGLTRVRNSTRLNSLTVIQDPIEEPVAMSDGIKGHFGPETDRRHIKIDQSVHRYAGGAEEQRLEGTQ